MKHPLRSGFLREKSGAVAIEFAVLVPILLVLVSASVVIFLFFQSSKFADRATSTVGDVVSRRTTVDNTFLNSSYKLFLAMTGRQAADVKFRVSSLTKQSTGFTVSWSYAVSPQVALTSSAIPTTRLPLVSDGDSIIVVETIVTPPSLNSYLPIQVPNYSNMEFIRPRFTSAVSKTD